MALAADAFCDQLGAELLNIVDERTGRPLVGRVMRTGDLYQGSCLDDLPRPCLVEMERGSAHRQCDGWRRDRRGRRGLAPSSAKSGVSRARINTAGAGEHRIGGLFIAAAPGIQSAYSPREV